MEIKVAFYLENRNIKEVDCRYPEKGNPGIGGTQYNFVTLSYYLNKYYSDKIMVALIANDINLLPDELKKLQASTIIDAEVLAKKNDIDVFIFRPKFDSEYNNAYSNLDELKLNSITWSHNMLNNNQLNKIENTKCILRHICVSHEQLDRIRDHNIFNKSNFIFNGFSSEMYNILQTHEDKNNEVTYIGSLSPVKGFHVIAKQWKEIVREVPDAKLNVIGSGNLYSRNAKLGKYGLAEESYEKQFIPYLLDSNGEILESVKFWGNLGTEKFDILKRTKVGVVNPTANSENCPGVALEFQASGIPVVSLGKYGLLDTVIHNKTGLLAKSEAGISKSIVRLLNNNSLSEEFGINGADFVNTTFNQRIIVDNWYYVFSDIINGVPNSKLKIQKFWFHNYKLLREFNRICKNFLPHGEKLPSLLFYQESLIPILNRIKKFFLHLKIKEML
jgi:glycosyltransferase involved in cell wall biosynthesis